MGSPRTLGVEVNVSHVVGEAFSLQQEAVVLALGESVVDVGERRVVRRTGRSRTRRGGVRSRVGLEGGDVV